jgi:hypothetical protein
MNLPKEIMEPLIQYCVDNKIGLAQAITDDFSIIILANPDLTPDQVAILCAHTLLAGVIQSSWDRAEEERIGKKNLESVN